MSLNIHSSESNGQQRGTEARSITLTSIPSPSSSSLGSVSLDNLLYDRDRRTCSRCNRRFSGSPRNAKQNKLRHLKSACSKRSSQLCRLPCRFEACGQTFSRSDNRIVHERKKHDIEHKSMPKGFHALKFTST